MGLPNAYVAHAQRTLSGDGWLNALRQRRHTNVAVVALANKNARVAWALLAHEREFRTDYAPSAA